MAHSIASQGVLERVGGVSRFTHFITHAALTLPVCDPELARRVLEKSEHGCLVANSLNAKRELKVELKTAGVAAEKASLGLAWSSSTLTLT